MKNQKRNYMPNENINLSGISRVRFLALMIARAGYANP